jgi:hypothetical protein
MKANPKALKASLVLALSACLLALPHARASRQTEVRGVGIRMEDGKYLKLYERSYALVIGVGDYTAGWPKLPGVKKDLEEVARALERQGFQVTKVENPDSVQLEKAFKEFIDTYGKNVESRLLFYFAGHGHTLRQSYGEETGYIVPTDAPLPTRDKDGFMSKAMDMQQMEIYARRIQSKHALFLFDSCFSGAIFALSSRAIPDSISYNTARPVRQFITSGSADETVPDRSIFREQFIEAIEGEADSNHDNYVTGTELGMFLQDKVINYSKNTQHPQYGKIRNPNLDKGDFVFALPKKAAPTQAATRPNSGDATSLAQPALVDPLTVEIAFWDSIKNSSDPADFRAYLDKYPAGQFSALAKNKLDRFAPKAAASSPNTGGASSAAILNLRGVTVSLVYTKRREADALRIGARLKELGAVIEYNTTSDSKNDNYVGRIFYAINDRDLERVKAISNLISDIEKVVPARSPWSSLQANRLSLWIVR